MRQSIGHWSKNLRSAILAISSRNFKINFRVLANYEACFQLLATDNLKGGSPLNILEINV